MMYPFEGERIFVRNAWYVAAWSAEVGRDLLSRTILDEPVVLYRRTDGRAVALAGLCALSLAGLRARVRFFWRRGEARTRTAA